MDADHAVSPLPQRRETSGATILALMDYAFATLVLFLSFWAFAFLGLHTPLWYLCYLYFLTRAAMFLSEYVRFLSWNLIYLAYPAACLFSTLWSVTPVETFKFSVQLIFTSLIGIFIGMRFSVRDIFGIVFFLLLFLMIMSLVNYNSIIFPAYNISGKYLGVFLTKNGLGQATVFFSLGCTCLLFMPLGAGPGLRLICALGGGAAAFLLSIAGSVTGILLSLGIPALVLVIYALATSSLARALVIVPLFATVMAIFLVIFFQIDPVADLLGLMGRDPTLTGRTDLWQVGWTAYLERPFLGHGANVFWNDPSKANIAFSLQRVYGTGVLGFHNILIELVVMLGPLGIVVHSLIGYATFSRAIGWLQASRNPLAAWSIGVGMTVYFFGLFGTSFIKPHEAPGLLMVVLGAALVKQTRAFTHSQLPLPKAIGMR